MKKIIAWITVAAFLGIGVIILNMENTLSNMSIIAEANDILTYGDLTYQICDNEDNEERYISITGCAKEVVSVEIPSEIGGILVTNIGDYAFEKCKEMTSIKITDSVLYIGTCAFEECTNLQNVIMSNNIREIGYYAFANCKKITNIKIPNSIQNIRMGAFQTCINLDNIKIPNTITTIEKTTFCECLSLTNIEIPDSVTSIEGTAFQGCTNLKEITIPDSVTTIDFSAFEGCVNLINIEIPDGVTSIESSAFSECEKLSSITIPNSVTFIGWAAFKHCTKLADVYYNGTEEQWNLINIIDYNDSLRNAKIHFNYKDATGDINGDGDFTVSDVVSFQKWLLGSGKITDWKAGDFDKNDNLNIFDLCIMKHKLLNK